MMSRSTSALVTLAILAAAGCGSADELDDSCDGAAADCTRDDSMDDLPADADRDPDGSAPADDATAPDGVGQGSDDPVDDSGADADPGDGAPDAPDAPDVVTDSAAGTLRFNIRFATYNVRTSNLNNRAWGDTHVGWDSNDAARMRRVAATIASQDLTVVALQEVRRPERTAIVQQLLQQHEQTWGATTQDDGADDTMVIFDRSVWRKVKETHFVIPMQPGLNDRAQIGVLLEHQASGERVWFYSVHLAAAGGDGDAARLAGIRRTVSSIRREAVDHGQLFVLGGDFNTDASGAVGDALRGAGFAKNARSAADRNVNDGCKTFNPSAGSAGHQSCPGGVARHIDQVWVSRSGLKVLRYEVTANELTSRSSDHNPLTTILKTQ